MNRTIYSFFRRARPAALPLLSAAAAACLAACPAWAAAARTDDPHAGRREAMVRLIADYDPELRVTDERVLAAMRLVPRHEFVPASLVHLAYDDHPLPIGEGQTISQPFIVAYMTQMLELKPGARVLEVGTGSGYQAAVLAELGAEVYSVEIIPSLARRAARTLKRLGYRKVRVKAGDGYRGWPEAAPFDAVIVTCAPDHIPGPLAEQLKPGGRMAIPVDAPAGRASGQELVLVRKTPSGMRVEKRMDVRFVPMTGEAEKPSGKAAPPR